MNIKKEIYDMLVDIIKHESFSCTQPVEYDYHEYSACEKCSNCLTRKRLKSTGIKEFEHFWSK